MNSRDWDRRQFTKKTNPSGEVIRTKTYHRMLIMWDNVNPRTQVAERKRLADLLGIPVDDILADLDITINIQRYPRHRKYIKYDKYAQTLRQFKPNKKEIANGNKA